MKLNISLATLALGSLVTGYCVKSVLQPTLQSAHQAKLQPAVADSQEVILGEEYIPGRNNLEYCSEQIGNEPLDILEIDISPTDPYLNDWNQVEIFAFLHEPMAPGALLRISDSTTGETLVESIDLFEYLDSIGVEPPRNIGLFHTKFYLLPDTLSSATKKITLELHDKQGREYFCVKSPVQVASDSNP